MAEDNILLQASGIAKAFHGVPALTNGQLTLTRGTVHALCGGNGAGKSTFLNIVMGLLRRDAGSGHRLCLAQADRDLRDPRHLHLALIHI